MLISLTGPSGVGKGFWKHRICQAFPGFTELVWVTTRSLRQEEKATPVSNRRCVSHDDFHHMRNEKLLVHEQELYGNWYALPVSELVRAQTSHCLTEVHIDNLAAMRAYTPQMLALALVPVSVDVLRKHLLEYRGVIPGEDIERRLAAAECEARLIREFSSSFSLMVEIGADSQTHVEQLITNTIRAHLLGKDPHESEA